MRKPRLGVLPGCLVFVGRILVIMTFEAMTHNFSLVGLGFAFLAWLATKTTKQPLRLRSYWQFTCDNRNKKQQQIRESEIQLQNHRLCWKAHKQETFLDSIPAHESLHTANTFQTRWYDSTRLTRNILLFAGAFMYFSAQLSLLDFSHNACLLPGLNLFSNFFATLSNLDHDIE